MQRKVRDFVVTADMVHGHEINGACSRRRDNKFGEPFSLTANIPNGQARLIVIPRAGFARGICFFLSWEKADRLSRPP